MGEFLSTIGVLGFMISLIMLIIRIIKKKPKKPIIIALVISLLLAGVGGSNTETNEQKVSDNKVTIQENNETKQALQDKADIETTSESDNDKTVDEIASNENESQTVEDANNNEANADSQANDNSDSNVENTSTKTEQTSSQTASIKNENTELKVHFIDVGQGDSIFIDYGDYDILIDAGENDQGQKVVNYLKSLGTDDIEIMVATHPHSDHIGGLDDVLKAFDVEKIIDSGVMYTTKTYEDYINAVSNEKEEIGAKFIYDDDLTFKLGDNVMFKVIELGDGYENINDNSVVTMLDYNNVEFLFTGDLEADVEKANLNKFSDIDILKVGHHGSKTSTSQEFLEVVKPEIAVISAGIDNEYGHPHLETLVRLGNYVDAIYGTWKSGNIVITTDGNTYQVNTDIKVDIPENKEEPTTTNTQTEENTSTNVGVIIKNIDLSKEIVTIQNTTNKDIDMTGWKLVSEEGNQIFNFPDGYILKANSSITIASGKATGDLKWTKKYIWNNDGDTGILYNDKGKEVSRY